MIEKHSIIIHPYNPVIKRFKVWKNELFLKIGDYRNPLSLCAGLALRKLNQKVGQFEIIEIFPFSGKPPKSKTIQLSLF